MMVVMMMITQAYPACVYALRFRFSLWKWKCKRMHFTLLWIRFVALVFSINGKQPRPRPLFAVWACLCFGSSGFVFPFTRSLSFLLLRCIYSWNFGSCNFCASLALCWTFSQVFRWLRHRFYLLSSPTDFLSQNAAIPMGLWVDPCVQQRV